MVRLRRKRRWIRGRERRIGVRGRSGEIPSDGRGTGRDESEEKDSEAERAAHGKREMGLQSDGCVGYFQNEGGEFRFRRGIREPSECVGARHQAAFPRWEEHLHEVNGQRFDREGRELVDGADLEEGVECASKPAREVG